MKEPRQPRSQASTARIVAAAEWRLAQGGHAALDLAAILSEARTSVGSFYARFGDLFSQVMLGVAAAVAALRVIKTHRAAR